MDKRRHKCLDNDQPVHIDKQSEKVRQKSHNQGELYRVCLTNSIFFSFELQTWYVTLKVSSQTLLHKDTRFISYWEQNYIVYKLKRYKIIQQYIQTRDDMTIMFISDAVSVERNSKAPSIHAFSLHVPTPYTIYGSLQNLEDKLVNYSTILNTKLPPFFIVRPSLSLVHSS